ncbi:MAG: ABC transporter permease [Candidatus Angelobacter sp. Gp1-AA117]|nr:MAG: ABC transporter permease [Candidatus Angelobacter sp. Gp1-AA117]
MERLWRDLKYGIRTLAKSPGFTIIAVLTLALGIGANTAIFSVVNSVVLAPLPYRQPDQLVIVWAKNPAGRYIAPSYPDFQDWQRDTHSFQEMAAFNSHAYDVTHPGVPEHLDGCQISPGFFRTLGVNLVMGRDFSSEENRAGGAPVAIISEHVWKNHFTGSAAALGKTITMDGASYTVIGVAPSTIDIGGTIDVYTPVLQGNPLTVSDRRTHAFVPVARLKPGTSIAQAEADAAAVEKKLGELYPKFDQGLSAGIVPLKEALVGDVSGMLLMLLGSVGVVLLIACANVASLLLARSAAREREFAIRSALGAQRFRLIGQMVTESVLLSLAGGGLGLLLAKWGVRPLLAAVPGDVPRTINAGLNPAVLLFTFAVSIAVGILFGLLPALKSSGVHPQTALKAGGRGAIGTHHRIHGSLVVIQTALTLVLLVGAGLLLRTIRHLGNVNPGFDTHQLVAFKVGISPAQPPENLRIADRQLIERIQKIPGVESADLTTLVPLTGMHNEVPFWVGPDEPKSLAEAPRALTFSVGPDYFRTMGIPLLQGRSFTPADTVQSEQVAIIDSRLADKYFPGQNAVGKTFSVARVGQFRIIGVVGHVKHWGLGELTPTTQMQVYGCFYQINDEWMPVMQPSTTVLVRTRLDERSLLDAVRKTVYGAGNEQPIYGVKTMQETVSASMATQSFPMVLLMAFAGLALVLATVGIYGLLAYFVQRRTQEIGIRMALGAQRQDVFRMLIARGLKLNLAGIAIGISSALLLARVLSSFSNLLYGVGVNDPLTLIAASSVLTLTAILACYVPARRAAMVAPTEALRQE